MLTFARAGAAGRGGPATDARGTCRPRGGSTLPEQCRRLIPRRSWRRAAVRPGRGPRLRLDALPADRASQERRAAARARRCGEPRTRWRRDTGPASAIAAHFPGISDMSFLGQVDPAAVPAIAANTPAWGRGIAWPAGGQRWACRSSTPARGGATTTRRSSGCTPATPSRCCRTCCSRSSVACWTIPSGEAADYSAAISTCLVPEVVMPTCFQAFTSLPATPAP